MADWAPLDDTAPPEIRDTRDILVLLAGGRQIVVRWDPSTTSFVAIDGKSYTPVAYQLLPDLPPAPPVGGPPPVLTSLAPATAVLGDPSFTLHVYGTGFAADAVIFWNGSPEPTVVVSDTEVTTGVDMTTATVAIPIPITVQNGPSAPSNALTFTLTDSLTTSRGRR